MLIATGNSYYFYVINRSENALQLSQSEEVFKATFSVHKLIQKAFK